MNRKKKFEKVKITVDFSEIRDYNINEDKGKEKTKNEKELKNYYYGQTGCHWSL